MVDIITPSEAAQEFENRAKGDFQSRFQRMDDDFDIWNFKKVKYEEGETAINVISNTPRTFANAVQAKLVASDRQIIITPAEREGADIRDEVAKLERLFEFALYMGDKRLVNLLLPPLKDYSIWCSLIRGWVAGRFLVYQSGKNVIFDLTPFDPRWLVYSMGSDGLSMAEYKTFRTRDDLWATYKYDPPHKPNWQFWGEEKDSFEVIDCWYGKPGKITNTVVCGADILRRPKTSKISMPVIVLPVATRPPVISNMGLQSERYGDSIYSPNREIFALKNQLLSMWFTHAKLLAKQPLINYYGENGKRDINSTILHPGMFINLPKDENEIVSSPMKEVSPTLVNALSLIQKLEEEGSLPALELTKPPPSGTALAIIQEARDKIFGPQLRLLDNYYTAICEKIEEQLLSNKITVDVKVERNKKYFETQVTPVDIGRPHIIRVEHTATNPWQLYENYQIADMAKRQGLPDEFIWENIIKVQDPKGLADLAALEVWEHSPAGMRVKAIRKALREGRTGEAQAMMKELYDEEKHAETIPGSEGTERNRTLSLSEA